MARLRAGQGFPEFAASLGERVPEGVARCVFEYVQKNWAFGVKNFPVKPEDHWELFSFDEEDLEEAAYELAKACGKEKPLLNIWRGKPIENIGDLARFIAHLPTPEQVRAEGSRRLWTDQ